MQPTGGSAEVQLLRECEKEAELMGCHPAMGSSVPRTARLLRIWQQYLWTARRLSSIAPVSLDIVILGPVRIVQCGQEVGPSRPKLRQLVGLLAVSGPRAVTHQEIADELWNGTRDMDHAHACQTHIWNLRKVLAADARALEHVAGVGYRLDRTAVQVDADALVDLAGHTEEQVRAEAYGEVAQGLSTALDLVDAIPLADLPLGPVLRPHQVRLRTLGGQILGHYLRALLALGDLRAVVAETDRVLRRSHSADDLYASIITARARLGRQAEAIELFHEVRTRTFEQFGIGPGRIVVEALEEAMAQPTRRTGRLAER